MNDENLKGHGFDEITASKQREIASKGGKASVEARRQKKSFREIGSYICEATMNEGEIFSLEDLKEIAQMKGANVNVKTLMMWQQIQKALAGDTEAFKTVRDTLGEKPSDKLEVATMDNEAITEFEQFVYGQKRDS